MDGADKRGRASWINDAIKHLPPFPPSSAAPADTGVLRAIHTELLQHDIQVAGRNNPRTVYAILDANRMDKKQLYTALSRGKTPKQIRLDPGTVNHRDYVGRQPELELSNANVNSLCQDGKLSLVELSYGHKYV